MLTKLKVKIVGCPLPVAASPVQTRAFSMQDPRMVAAKSVKDRYIDHLIKTPGISAVGIGVVNKASQQLGLIIYVTKGSVAAKAGAIPLRIENLPVKIFETSGFKLM